MVREKYGVDTFLVNDASAAALGEHRFGAGKGASNLIYLTVSTGIGGGIIVDGELYTGSCGSAGEVGHMTIAVNGSKCACGNIGCWETLASGTAVARVAAQGGDPLAWDVIRTAATYLGVGMVNLVNIFNPELIIVGGGMAKLGDLLLEPARRLVGERAFPVSAKAVRIVTAQLGDEAGVYGAASLAFAEKRGGDQVLTGYQVGTQGDGTRGGQATGAICRRGGGEFRH